MIFKPDAIEAVAEISAGVPRVINLLCDRSLELAFDAQVHTIDGARVHAAARGLGIEKDAAAPVPRPTRTSRPGDCSTKGSGARTGGRAGARGGRAGSGHAGCGRARGVREIRTCRRDGRRAAPGRAGCDAAHDKAPPPRAPGGCAGCGGRIRVLADAESGVGGASASRGCTSRAGADQRPRLPHPPRSPRRSRRTPALRRLRRPRPATEAPATAERFDIIVASFRTDARATSVAEQVTALGVPVRRRESDGWQQVIAGPFASRAAAEEAQQRIHAAGLTGTQIAPATR